MSGLLAGLGSSFRQFGSVLPSGQQQRSSQPSPSIRPPPIQFSNSTQIPRSQLSGQGIFGRGPNSNLKGRGLGGKLGPKRRRKIIRDSIYGITKGDIRRLARRGGVKRMSGLIYDEIRQVVKDRVWMILNDCSKIVDHRGAKTVTVYDIIFTLKRLGTPMYGFGDVETRRLGRK